jgi:hypothetical protein
LFFFAPSRAKKRKVISREDREERQGKGTKEGKKRDSRFRGNDGKGG